MERRSMVDSSDIGVLVAGMGIGVAGFMPMLAVVLLARKKCMRPTVGKGMAALAISFVFLMAVLALMWAVAPADLVVFAIGFLGGFLVMWAVLAVITMSRRL